MTTADRPPVEIRAAAIDRVDFPDRVVDVIAVPYGEWTRAEYRGRIIEESFERGAFGAIDNRIGRSRLLVNLEHDPARWLGRVVGLHPGDDKGLRAEVQIRRTAEGDQILLDAADGMLGASVGFGVFPADQVWESRDRRRIRKAFLDHLALTATPAYAGAEVIAVRSAPAVVEAPTSATPNLDAILATRDLERYSARAF